MNEYTKLVDLQFKLDTSEAKQAIKELKESSIKNLLTKSEMDKLVEETDKKVQVKSDIDQLQKAINTLSEAKDTSLVAKREAFEAELKNRKKLANELGVSIDGKKVSSKMSVSELSSKMFESIKREAIENITEIFDNARDYIKNIFSEAKDELLKMSKYSYQSSIFQNVESRTYALQYGLSGAQSYGLTKTMSALGLSEEDLYWMNPTQQKAFQELMTSYTERYNKLADEGFFEKMEEFTLEWDQFKEGLLTEAMKFIVDNKDTIMNVLKLSIDFMKGVISALGWLFDAFAGQKSESSLTSATNDIISNYANATNTTTNNVSVNNTFTGGTTQDKASLINDGQLIYQQIVKAING